MSFLTKLFSRRSRKEPVSQEDLAKYLRGEEVWTGVEVDRPAAMGITAVWACVRVLSETLASLPLFLYKRLEKGKEKAIEHPIYKLLHVRPNSEQTPFAFKETLMCHLVLQGNCYAQKIRNKGGGIAELWPLNPEKMKVTRNAAGLLDYEYKKNETSTPLHLTREQVFHVPGLGYDGIKGYSVLEIAKQSFGMSIASQRYGAEFFQNGAVPSGIIEHPHHLKDDAAKKRFKESWGDAHKDWGKKHSIGILEDGSTYKAISISPEHAQWLETRRFELNEVCRWFRMQPHLVGDLTRSTNNNIEHQGIEFVVYTMRPWLVRWEQCVALQLLNERDQGIYFAEFLVDALLRGDMRARAEAYRTFREIGVFSANDICELENRNPVEGGDKRYVPMNWIDMNAEPEPIAEQPVQEEEEEEEESTREKRAAMTRYRIASSYVPLLAERIQRIVRREGRDIKAAMRKHLRSQGEFDLFLQEYYRKLPEYIRDIMTPAFRSMAENVKGEIGLEIDIGGELLPEEENFIRAYSTIFAQRHVGISQAYIRKIIDRSIDEQIDLIEELTAELDNWPDRRGAGEALNEAVRGSNAFARNAYMLAGVLYLRWVSLGPKSCPYCNQMDGTIVGVENNFALPGDVLTDVPAEMNIQHKCGHPPLHRGCVCQIMAA